MHHTPEVNLLFIKGAIVLPRRRADGVVLRIGGLNQHPAGLRAAPGTSGALREQLEDALGGAEVGQGQRGIGGNHPHQRHAGEVVPLGDHLRADQQIQLSPTEAVENPPILSGAMRYVAVQSADARGGEHLRQQVRQLLRPRPHVLQVLGPARTTEFRKGTPEAAVVAHQAPFSPMVGERNATVFALLTPPATATQHEPGVPPAVDQDHHLRVALQLSAELLPERLRNRFGRMRLPELFAHVENLDLGQRPALNPFVQLQQFIAALLSVPVGFQRRGGRTQQGDNSGPLGADNRQVTSVIARLLLLLVARVVLLIHDHQSQVSVGNRRHHGRTRADHQPGLAAPHPPPFRRPLPRPQGAVQHGHLPGKPRRQKPLKFGGQGDFRHQHQRPAAPLQHLGQGPQIDLRLAAARHPVQQHHLKAVFFQPRANPGQGLFLSGGELFNRKVRTLNFIGRRCRGWTFR